MLKRRAILPTDPTALTDRIASRAWSSIEVGTVFGTLFLCYLLASLAGPFFHEEQIPLVQLGASILMYLIVGVLMMQLTRRHGGGWGIRFGMSIRELNKAALAPLFYLGALPVLLAAAKLWHLLLHYAIGLEIELQDVAQAITQEASWLQGLYILTAILVASFFEEILFRGIAWPYLVKHLGLVRGTLLLSALFAAIHFHLPSFIPLFLLSIVLCFSYWRTGSLWVSIGVHAISNAVTILALQSVVKLQQ